MVDVKLTVHKPTRYGVLASRGLVCRQVCTTEKSNVNPSPESQAMVMLRVIRHKFSRTFFHGTERSVFSAYEANANKHEIDATNQKIVRSAC